MVREFRQGEFILGPGASGDEIRFLLSGRASVVLRDGENDRVAVNSLGPGDLFGGIDFFFGVPWSAGLISEMVTSSPSMSNSQALAPHHPPSRLPWSFSP